MIARDVADIDIRVAVRCLRSWNEREIFATRSYAPDKAGLDRVAEEIIATQRLAIGSTALIHNSGAIGAIVSAYRTAPRAAAVGMVMTDAWPSIGAAAWRYLKRTFIPQVLVPNVNVAETAVMCGGPYSFVWLYRLGFLPLGRPLPRGNAGERFQSLAWVNPMLDVAAGRVSSASRPA